MCVTIKVKEDLSEKDLKALCGTYMDYDDSWIIINSTTRVLKPDGSLLCHLLKQHIPQDLCTIAVENYMQVGKMVSTNRGYAAGASSRDHTYNFDKGKTAHSGILGFIDSPNSQKPCRLTKFGRSHFEKYQRGLPFIKRIDALFREVAPDKYAAQEKAAASTEFHIEGTAFSTVTVNYNFRTALHKDNGDYAEGLGNLVVCQEHVRGGFLLFPKYKVAIQLETGDFLAMDVHEWHCNSPIELQHDDGYRLSFVCYFRERMMKCENINKGLQLIESNASTSDVINKIFSVLGKSIPKKDNIGTGKHGDLWWIMENEEFELLYKHKRYRFVDKKKKVIVHNLLPTIAYVTEIYGRT